MERNEAESGKCAPNEGVYMEHVLRSVSISIQPWGESVIFRRQRTGLLARRIAERSLTDTTLNSKRQC